MTFKLEAPDTVYVGEAITGTIHTTRPVRISVRRVATWQHTASDPEQREVDSVVMNESGPFKLSAINGPLTYVGERIELAYSVVAEAIDGPPDSTVAPFVLVAPRVTTPDDHESETWGGYRDRPIEATKLTAYLGDQYVEGPRRPGPTDPFEIMGAWVAHKFAALATPRAGVSDVTFDVTPSRVRAGGELVAKLAFTTHEEIVVESIAIQLAMREHSRMTRRASEPLVESRIETLSERAQLAPGSHTYEGRLRVPVGAAPSFATQNVAVEWSVRLTIQIDGRADEETEIIIGVAPF